MAFTSLCWELEAAGLAAGQAHKPWLPIYGDLQLFWWCSLTVVYFEVGQVLAHIEINTAVHMNTTLSPALLKHFACGCYGPKSYRHKPSQKCQLASMWEDETWWGSSSLLGKQKHWRLKKKKKKGSFKKFHFVSLTSSNEQWQKECSCWEHMGCWGKVGQNSRNCFLNSLELWRHQPAPPRSCEISTYLHHCNNNIALKRNNEDNTLQKNIFRNHSYSMCMNIICKYKFHLIKKCW